MSDIVIESLSKRYGRETWALGGVSLSIRSGEILALVGASGCGKTTLLRCIAGFEEPTEGCIRLGDAVVCGNGRWLPPERRRVGVVFQEHALFPHLRVDANVMFGVRGVPRAERARRAEAHLERVGLPGLGRRYPHELSGGQRRRVALARALALRPRVVLLDEPLTGLDEPLRDALRDEVHEVLREAGATAVWVTHRASDALAVADRVAAFGRGRLAQLGPPGEVYEAPASPYVARLFGAINILEGFTERGATRTPLGRFSLGAEPGQTSVGVRPEHLWLRAAPEAEPPGAGEGADAPAAVTGRVESTSFYGVATAARVALSDGSRLSVRLTEPRELAPGTEVSVGIRGGSGAESAGALQVFPVQSLSEDAC